jgi:hypothetical protein
MQLKYLISTSKAPKDAGNAISVGDVIVQAAHAVNLDLQGIKGMEAPSKSCYNIALAFAPNTDKEACEIFMMEVARAFFPSRWCDCADPDFTGFDFTL